VFLVCFSVVNPVSFENVTSKWFPEVNHFCPNVPLIVVGTKLDLRNDNSTLEKLKGQGQRPVTHEEGEELARKLKAVKFIECSAFTGTDSSSRVIQPLRPPPPKCLDPISHHVVGAPSPGENLKTVFDDAVKSVLFSKRKKTKGGCSLF
jgi:GTPase SAR1 family protein